ncbi:MAG TPA: 4Fe-4S binding protein [Armatimonadota bacterium]|nr:4Fe-4S binding protein [Armatimonadota bacterium]
MADDNATTRRAFLTHALRGLGLLAVGGAAAALAQAGAAGTVWQIDPDACIQCGQCATHCVLRPSAVKCVHTHALCGYCKLCFGYFESESIPDELTGTGAEFQRCPTDAIRRRFVEDPFYEYVIDESRCIGCGTCVKGCAAYGNGSLFLQIRHDRCVHCNACAIAAACPARAIRRVPADRPYLLKQTRAPA